MTTSLKRIEVILSLFVFIASMSLASAVAAEEKTEDSAASAQNLDDLDMLFSKVNELDQTMAAKKESLPEQTPTQAVSAAETPKKEAIKTLPPVQKVDSQPVAPSEIPDLNSPDPGIVQAVNNIVNTKALYRFQEHLAEAEATILFKEKEYRITGVWKDRSFLFPKLNPQPEIKLAAEKFDGAPKEGIRIPLAPEGVTRLRFLWVPPGAKMVVYYGIEDAAILPDENFSMYLRVWIGQHELERIQIANEKGWKKAVVDLGLISFLGRTVSVTFELSGDHIKGNHCFISAEILDSSK